jgi:hypothetical protein
MASSYMTMERTPNEDCNLTETSINKLVEFKIHKALLSFFFKLQDTIVYNSLFRFKSTAYSWHSKKRYVAPSEITDTSH